MSDASRLIARVATIVVLLCSPAILGAQGDASGKRVWMRGTWSQVGGLPPNSGVVAQPGRIVSFDSGVIVFDYADGMVKAFTAAGEVLWRFGGRESTAAFDHPTSIAVDPRGRVWVTDPNPGRVTILSRAGALERVIEGLRGVASIAPRADGSFWSASMYESAPALFDSAGKRIGRVNLPWAPRQAAYSSHNAPDTLVLYQARPHLAHSDTLVVAYGGGDRFVVASRGGAVVHEYRGLQRVSFPRLAGEERNVGGKVITVFAGDPPLGSLSSATDRGLLYTLFVNGGRDAPERNRTVDVYRLRDGRYQGSYLLPEGVTSLTVRGDLFFATTHDAVRVWRWTPAP